MKKKCRELIVGLLILSCLSFPVFAVDLSVRFSLTSNGRHEVTTMTGDVIDVRFSVQRVDDHGEYSVNALQNYIRYDTEFFELVEGSVHCQKSSGSASSQNTLVGPRIYMTDMTASYAPDQEFGSFQLKVIGKSGSARIENGSALAYDRQGNPIAITESNLLVKIDDESYPVFASSNQGGTITPSGKQIVSAGSQLTFTITPDPNYVIKSLLIDGTPVAAVNSYTFEHIDRSHTIEAIFERASSGGSGGGGGGGGMASEPSPGSSASSSQEPHEEQETTDTPCPMDETCPLDSFVDTKNDLWWHDGIHFCLENGLMQGIGNDHFNPTGATTRGMIVTILWRREESPDVPSDYPVLWYTDVKSSWYFDAVRWGSHEEVINGYGDGRFGPDDPITREQLATILYRYAAKMGRDSSEFPTNPLPFTDRTEISKWADQAVQWCYLEGIVNGKDGNLFDPQGSATRAETAAMLERFCRVVEQEPPANNPPLL